MEEKRNPLVSVLIPSFNHQDYILYTIESIANQDYANIEILVIDDGSTDGSYELITNALMKFQARFKRTYSFQQKNMGVSLTLNKLIEAAHGEYVYIIASDDVACKTAISTLVRMMERDRSIVLTVGDCAFINCHNERVRINQQFQVCAEKKGYKTMGDLFKINNKKSRHSRHFGEYKDLLLGNYIPNGYLIRIEALNKVGRYDPGMILEDWYINLQLAKVGKFKYIKMILYLYRIHCHNTIQTDKFRLNTKIIAKQILHGELEYLIKKGYFLDLALAVIKLYCPIWMKRIIKSIWI